LCQITSIMYNTLTEIVKQQREVWQLRPKDVEASQKLGYHSRLIAELSINLKVGQTYVLDSPDFDDTYVIIKHSNATVEVSTAQFYHHEQNEIQRTGGPFQVPGRNLSVKTA